MTPTSPQDRSASFSREVPQAMKTTGSKLVGDDSVKWLSDDEVLTLVKSCLADAGNEGVSQDELERVLDWAQEARIDHALLKAVLEGRINVRWRTKDGQPRFRDPYVEQQETPRVRA